VHVDHTQPVVQVVTETSLRNFERQVAMRRGNQAHVDRTEPDFSNPADFVGLQHPEQPSLQRRRHIADFVEKQGAAPGRFEHARTILDGAREGAARVAEELGFEQRLGELGAADREERRLAAPGPLVDQPGHVLLPHAAFAGDQYSRVGRRHAAHQRDNSLHARARQRNRRVRGPEHAPA